MKPILSILLVLSTHLAASGQSTTTSSTADSLVLTKYQQNSKAILDSLIRFEFTKQRFQALSAYNFELILEKTKLSNLSLTLSSQNDVCQIANNKLRIQAQKDKADIKKLQEKNTAANKKNRRSAFEKWSWRGAAFVGLILKFSPYL